MTEPAILVGRSPGRQDLQPGQTTQVIVADLEAGTAEVVLESDELVEAPNWTPDDRLVLNSRGGLLLLLDLASRELEQLDLEGVDRVNNDHIVSPDGTRILFSAAGALYEVPIAGGGVRRISNEFPPERKYHYWLHGVSGDGGTLAYVATQATADDPDPRALIRLATIPTAGGADTYLTGEQTGIHFDGPEYSGDGAWIYYNSEEAARRPGHAQVFRMRPDGTGHEQLFDDDRVNWFPHLDPAGRRALYLSYEPGTLTHPADVELLIRLLDLETREVRDVVSLFGGQGSLNVNSWSPDGRRFAYAAYPAPGIGGGIDRWSA